MDVTIITQKTECWSIWQEYLDVLDKYDFAWVKSGRWGHNNSDLSEYSLTEIMIVMCLTQCRLLLLLLQVTSVMSDSVWPHRRQPTRLLRPWDSPGKNTGVGCQFLLQCMKVKSEREVAQSCPILRDPVDRPQPTRLLYPWDFPGKSTGVGCHHLLWGNTLIKTKVNYCDYYSFIYSFHVYIYSQLHF